MVWASANKVGFAMISPSAIILGMGLVLAAGALAWSAISDVCAYQIPNWTSALIAASYLIVAFATPYAPWVGGLLTGLGVLILGLGLFALGWMGGGDVKLFSALAIWSGPSHLAAFALVTCLAGAGLALIMLSPLKRLAPSPPAEAHSAAGQPMPYGVAIAVGGFWVLAHYAPLVA
jgi:prepilin peptidase CpaA